MKISKIFKRKEDQAPALPKGIIPEPGLEMPAKTEPQAGEPATKDTSSVKISSVLNKELEKISEASPSKLYAEVFEKTKFIYTADLSKEQNFIPSLNPLVERIIDGLSSGNTEVLQACLRDYPHQEELLYYHTANVAIASVAIGLFLGYERNRLVELGVAALVHDIGAKNVDIASKPDAFTEAEYDKVKRHPEEGVNILNKIDPGLNQRILEAVRQEHERADGSGYPQGLVANEINEYAQIIGLADVYEAMMHKRPYRDKYTSLETIRIILKNKKIFSRKVVKALIETFGIFPVDTLVQLNTREIGVVIKSNPDQISRPVIDILIDSNGKELRQPKRINMAENPVIYIDTCVKAQITKGAV